ncbi:MAG: hypothetical protein RIS47_167 [Bacteroidota bacterium]
MIKSMTGFGKAKVSYLDKTIHIEIKSLNSKQLDANLRIPSVYREKELELRNLLNFKLIRGKVDIQIYFEAESDKKVQISSNVVKQYYAQMLAISQDLGIIVSADDLFPTILQMPEVLESARQEVSETEWDTLFEGFGVAMGLVDEFRIQEGAALEADLLSRISLIQDYASQVVSFEPDREVSVRERLLGSLKKLGQDTVADNERFEQELIYYLEKYDITEEKVRLANHCKYFLETLEQETIQGKKLGFITQEIGREINTMGSKANNTDIQRLVVQMKDELEKMKEQLLNIL